MHIGGLWQEMYRSQYFEGGRHYPSAGRTQKSTLKYTAPLAVVGAIHIALAGDVSESVFYDIAGKTLGVPVYQLLGGKQRDFVPCFATTFAESLEKLIEDTNLLIESGWNVIRTAPVQDSDPTIFEPRESIAITASQLTQLREAVGPAPVLGIDYHHRLSVAEAASFCQRMPSGTLDFLEEPIRDQTPAAYESLRQMVDVPFAIGEEISSKWDFLPYLERGITNFARIDVCNVGGLTEAMKVASLAETHYIDLMPHNPLGSICTAATVHLAAAVPNFAWLEVRVSPTERADFTMKIFSRCNQNLKGTASWCPIRQGLVLSSMKRWQRIRPLHSGKHRTGGAVTDLTPTGRWER